MGNNNEFTEKNTGGGQNISVRPGNFITPNGERPAGGKKRNRGGRNRHRGGQNRPPMEQGQAPQSTAPAVKAPPSAPQPQNGERGGKKHNRGGRNRNRGRDRAERQETPEIDATLQKELEADFADAAFSDSLLPVAGKKSEIAVEDTHEFDVDIATAGYLTENVPTGMPAPGEAAVDVIGVRFRGVGKVYFFTPDKEQYAVGDHAVVDTARGPELCEVVMPRRRVAERNLIQPLRAVLRRATDEDIAVAKKNRVDEKAALAVCEEKIAAHKLDMHLVDAQYTFDRTKLLFYFMSEGRVDFRDLVRDLAGAFHTRIELRQIGIRDESRLVGGLGMCGRPFCCATFLSDFGQVSVKMAKEQGLSINTSKISGACGRLMCCLRYEQDSYRAELAAMPRRDSAAETPEGRGVIVEVQPIAGTVKVKLNDAPDAPPKTYRMADVTVLAAAAARPETAEETARDE